MSLAGITSVGEHAYSLARVRVRGRPTLHLNTSRVPGHRFGSRWNHLALTQLVGSASYHMDDLSMEDVDNFDVAHAVEHATWPNNVPDREVVIEADDQVIFHSSRLQLRSLTF